MTSSKQWFDYFSNNLQVKRINWNQRPGISPTEIETIVTSLQAWQLGETSDGANLVKAGKRYTEKTGDYFYINALELFIKEEQKHGENLGRYLDLIGQPRIKENWGDTLFRKLRHLNNSMEAWTLTVITVECAAQVYYQALKDATNCRLLKEICTDILIDEAPHIRFQQERLAIIFQSKSLLNRTVSFYGYKCFYFLTSLVVWMAHRKLFRAGNNNFKKYCKKMNFRFQKTIGKLKTEVKSAGSFQNDPYALLARAPGRTSTYLQ